MSPSLLALPATTFVLRGVARGSLTSAGAAWAGFDRRIIRAARCSGTLGTESRLILWRRCGASTRTGGSMPGSSGASNEGDWAPTSPAETSKMHPDMATTDRGPSRVARNFEIILPPTLLSRRTCNVITLHIKRFPRGRESEPFQTSGVQTGQQAGFARRPIWIGRETSPPHCRACRRSVSPRAMSELERGRSFDRGAHIRRSRIPHLLGLQRLVGAR